MHTIASLQIGESGIISNENSENIPLQLLEMGCLPGEKVTLIRLAPLKDPLYICINDSHLAIRIETAKNIKITKNDE